MRRFIFERPTRPTASLAPAIPSIMYARPMKKIMHMRAMNRTYVGHAIQTVSYLKNWNEQDVHIDIIRCVLSSDAIRAIAAAWRYAGAHWWSPKHASCIANTGNLSEQTHESQAKTGCL
jgi:hypothetical protein